MSRVALLLILTIGIISCKKESSLPPTKVDLVKDNIRTEKLSATASCDEMAYHFEFPFFNGTSSQQALIHKDILDLLAPYVKDNNITTSRSAQDIFNDFIAYRKETVCNNPTKGISHLKVEHLTQNEVVLSYEITYKLDNQPHRLIRAFKKPDLSLLTLKQLVKEERTYDVQRIMDINMQNSVIELALDIPSTEQQIFRDFSMNTAFSFKDITKEEIPVGVFINEKENMFLQFQKSVLLPKEYPELNGDIKIEIEAQQLDYYFDLSVVRG